MAGHPPCSGSAPLPRRSLRPLSGASPRAHPVANPMATRQVGQAEAYQSTEQSNRLVSVCWSRTRQRQLHAWALAYAFAKD